MTVIAIIGFGNHVKKNILPALTRLEDVFVESIYVRDTSIYAQSAIEHCVALKSTDENIGKLVDWVYIATPISTHFELCKKYLKLGKNIICEKPLTGDSEKTQELLSLAESLSLELHEVCIYKNHKQYHHMINRVVEKKSLIRSACVKFQIPHLDPEDIRYSMAKGGGALMDLGYYPLSLILALFGEPRNISSRCFSSPGYEVDLAGTATFEYDQFYCTAEWGIGMPYENCATLVFQDSRETYNRIFAKPPSFNTLVSRDKGVGPVDVDIGADDQICNMFCGIFSGDDKHDTGAILEIARCLDSIDASC
jgi:predicted dehydrogenase